MNTASNTHTHICHFKVHLQEVVDGGDGMQHDDEEENVQTDAGEQEGPFRKTKTTQTRAEMR